MLQRYGLSQWIEKPLHAFENSMDVHRMQRLSNWLFAWWHGVLCLRAAVLSSLPLNGEGLPAPINKSQNRYTMFWPWKGARSLDVFSQGEAQFHPLSIVVFC